MSRKVDRAWKLCVSSGSVSVDKIVLAIVCGGEFHIWFSEEFRKSFWATESHQGDLNRASIVLLLEYSRHLLRACIHKIRNQGPRLSRILVMVDLLASKDCLKSWWPHGRCHQTLSRALAFIMAVLLYVCSESLCQVAFSIIHHTLPTSCQGKRCTSSEPSRNRPCQPLVSRAVMI